MGVITLQIVKSWISPVGGLEGQIAPHQQFVQSEVAARGQHGSARLERQPSQLRERRHFAHFVREVCYLVEPARRAG